MLFHGPSTIGRLVKTRTEKSPENKALGWIENNEVKSINFREYKTYIEIIAAAYRKLGINVGDKIAILSQTCREWHLLDIAALCARSCVVPIYPSYLPKDIDYIFQHSDSNVIIVENDKQVEKIIPLLGNWKNLKTIISIHELSEENLKKFRNYCSYFTFKDIIRIGTEEIKQQPDLLDNHIQQQLPEEIASIIYTSGTTGEPKGAVITQNAFVSMLKNIDKSIKGGFSSQDRSLVFLPLSHVLGRCDSLLSLIFGWEAIYAESMEKLKENILLVKPTVMIAVPRIFEKIYASILSKVEEGSLVQRHTFKWATHVAESYFNKIDQDLSPSALELLEYNLAKKLVFSKIQQLMGGKIRYLISGGAPLSPEIIKFMRYANLTILEGYGLTETVAPCCINPLSRQIPGTVGRPIGDVQFAFAADGEIMIKSEALLKEYYKNPEATHEALKDGWFYSGDIGLFTPEGYLKITDRKKDLIKTSGGKYVAPQKIENMAKLQPHISHIVVTGEQKKYLTALIGIEKERFLNIFDELDLPTDCSVEDLARSDKVKSIITSEVEAINSELAQYETIKKFTILPIELSQENYLTPSLKVKRRLIATQYNDLIEAMYQ